MIRLLACAAVILAAGSPLLTRAATPAPHAMMGDHMKSGHMMKSTHMDKSTKGSSMKGGHMKGDAMHHTMSHASPAPH